MSTIYMMDDADLIAKKIRKARTDAEPLPSEMEGLEGRAEAANLVGIYAALSDKSADDVLAEFGGQGFGTFKPALADLAVAELGPVAEKMRDLLNDKGELTRILGEGAGRAREIASVTMAEVRDIMGMVR